MPLTTTRHHRSLALICIGCTAAVLWLANFFGPYEYQENRWRDSLQRLGRKTALHPDIVFLGIDNSVVAAEPPDLAGSPELQAISEGMPWPRWVYGAVAKRLVEAGAKVVVFDVMFPTEKPGDEALQESFEKYADRIVIGGNLAPAEQESRSRYIPPVKSVMPRGERGVNCVGFVNFKPDWDGPVRRSLYRTTILEYFDEPMTPGQEELLSIAARAATKAGYGSRIPPGHTPRLFRFPVVSAVRATSIHEIFVNALWDSTYRHGEVFRDKIVIIGPAGNWVKDELPTPFNNVAGPIMHISALNAALQDEFLNEPSALVDNAIILLAGLIAWSFGAFIINPLLRVGLLTAVGAAYFGAVYYLYDRTGWFPMLLSPLLTLGTSGFISSLLEQIIERLEKARLRKTFERYVSRDVVKELLDNPESYLNSVGGIRKPVTVLFSDLRNFTTITENTDAKALVPQLNEYLDAMVTIVFANNGTLDKFIGDAVMAQWGGIYSAGEKTDAIRAVRTALQMREPLKRLNPIWKARGLYELEFGVGINHGEVTVGNVGCEAKMEVTIVGDAVNAAARLEGMTKQYHCELLIGESVEPFVREEFIVRTVGLSQPKGKAKPLEIFTVLGERQPGVEAPPWLEHYHQGVALYRRRQFAEASRHFATVLIAVPEDRLAADYLASCHEYIETPPPTDWNAVHVMKTK
jgi:adenylate cyclase